MKVYYTPSEASSSPHHNTCNLIFYGGSDIGQTRPNNEDAWLALPEIAFFALADGIGGSKGGAIAAQESLNHLAKSMLKLSTQQIDEETTLVEALRDAIERANQWVYQMGCSSELLSGMGSTLCCFYQSRTGIVYAHLGDSRIYRLRHDTLQRLTVDHSYHTKWAALHKHPPHTSHYPYRHVITRALGTQGKAHPDIVHTLPQANDLYLLCTDGLFNALSTEEIRTILLSSNPLAQRIEELLQCATRKSRDNVTALAIQYVDSTRV